MNKNEIAAFQQRNLAYNVYCYAVRLSNMRRNLLISSAEARDWDVPEKLAEAEEQMWAFWHSLTAMTPPEEE